MNIQKFLDSDLGHFKKTVDLMTVDQVNNVIDALTDEQILALPTEKNKILVDKISPGSLFKSKKNSKKNSKKKSKKKSKKTKKRN